MARGIKRKLGKAIKNVNSAIRDQTNQESLYSRGLSSEGYLGGYRDALNDVLLVLNGVGPNRGWDKNFWE